MRVLLAVLALFAMGGQIALAEEPALPEEAKSACLAWLSRIDDRSYSDCYDQASKVVKKQVININAITANMLKVQQQTLCSTRLNLVYKRPFVLFLK